MFDDVSSSSLRVAAAGLAARQSAIANNIANIETPGYRARKVEFEQALHGAIAHGDSPASVTPSTQNSLEPTRLNGNNVNLDTETLSSIDTMLRFQFASQAVDGSFAAVRTALRTTS